MVLFDSALLKSSIEIVAEIGRRIGVNIGMRLIRLHELSGKPVRPSGRYLSLMAAMLMMTQAVFASPSPPSLTSVRSDEVSSQDEVPAFDGAEDISDLNAIDASPDLNIMNMADVSESVSYRQKNETKNNRDDRQVTDSHITHVGLPPQVNGAISQVPLNAISPATLKTFVEAIDLVRRKYVEPVSDEVLLNDAMRGMLTELDSHAEFLDAEAYENLRAFTQGDIGEVGLKAVYQPEEGHWVVTAVSTHSPAAKAHIKVGDYLHQIDEVKLTGDKSSNDIEQMLSGIAGTQVDLVVSRTGRGRRSVTLQRNQPQNQDIQIRVQDSVAIVKLPVFQNNSRQKLLAGLARLNTPISGVILDIRDNPGGVLEAAVDIAGLFMADASVVQIQGRQGIERTLQTSAETLLPTLPVIILQNRYSASAAEVLASSLQTQKRAQIMGEISYGKGSVQSVIPVNDEQAIKLTVAHYLTADGRQIDNIGVTPDIELKDEPSAWEQQALAQMLTMKRPAGIRFILKPAHEPDSPTT